MKPTEGTLTPRTKLRVGESDITDSQYDQFGLRLAVADSTGNIRVYRKQPAGEDYHLENTFKAGCSHILSIAWGKGCFGELLALGTFDKRVSVWMSKGAEWGEIAWFEGHDGPVKRVAWGDPYYGCQVLACSTDGTFSVLEVTNGKWQHTLVKAHTGPVNCISSQKLLFLSEVGWNNTEKTSKYGLVATGGSDRRLCIWRQKGSSEESLTGNLFEEPTDQPLTMVFQLAVASSVQHVQWLSSSGSGSCELLYCLEGGELIAMKFGEDLREWQASPVANLAEPVSSLTASETGTVLLTTLSGSTFSISYKTVLPLTLSTN